VGTDQLGRAEQESEIGKTIRRSLRESNLLYQITETQGLGPANWSMVKGKLVIIGRT
jgi:hypothetical protein